MKIIKKTIDMLEDLFEFLFVSALAITGILLVCIPIALCIKFITWLF